MNDRSPAAFRRPIAVACGAAATATAALGGALLFGGVLTEKVIPGLGDAGPLTRFGLPVSRLLMDLSAVVTVGSLLAAAVLLPLTPATRRGRPGPGAIPGQRGRAATEAGDALDTADAQAEVPGDGTGGTADIDRTDRTEGAGKAAPAPAAGAARGDRPVRGTFSGPPPGEDGGVTAGRTRSSGTVRHRPGLSTPAIVFVRAASWLAVVWAIAAAATLIFTVSDILGEPVGPVISGGELSSFAGQLPQGTGLMLVLLLALVVALLARTTITPAGAMSLLVIAILALLPPPLTGHSSSAANHSVAITSLAMHVIALALWVGGLGAVGVYVWWAREHGPGLPAVVAGRFSRLALWCYVAVGVSGLANAVSRLPAPADLLISAYGRLLIAKIVLFVLLGLIGRWHRDRTIADLGVGRPRAFLRLAAAEIAVMAAATGIAVGLARTAPPVSTAVESTVKALIGYDMPPPLTVARLATMWRLDFFFAVLVVVLGGLYLAGLARLRRRGDPWPIGRTIAWFVGLLSIVVVTQSGVATYAPVLFSVHMAQHMVLGMLTPIFLVLGGPVTLALRALKPSAVRGDRGPREWITAVLHSRVTAFYANPAIATLLFVGSTYVLYFTPLFESAMRSHIGHIVMMVHFLAAGTLFFWVIIGVDPSPNRLPPTGRLLVLFVTMPFHAFFGIALMSISEPIAAGWYAALRHPWGSSLLSDQHTGGSIAWAFGEIPTFIVLVALVFQWFMEDERSAKRRDRRADRATAEGKPDDLADYNAYLASLEARGRGSGS